MYELNDNDRAMLRLVERILMVAMQQPGVPWSQKSSIARMLHVVTRLPEQSCAGGITVEFTGPRVLYGDAEKS